MKRIFILLATMACLASCKSSHNNGLAPTNSEVMTSLIMSRRSIRQYESRPISRDTLEHILDCAIHAPNGMNRQAYELRVVDNPTLLASISKAVTNDKPEATSRPGFKTIFAGAPCVVFIAHDTTYDVSQVDCGLLGENLILSAWSMGIGSCCMAYPTRLMTSCPSCQPYVKQLGFSPGYDLLYCITLGFPAEKPDARPRKDSMVRFVE